MTHEVESSTRRTDEEVDLMGVAGLGALGARRTDDDREQTAEQLIQENAAADEYSVEPRQNGPRASSLSAGGLSRRGALATIAGLGALSLTGQPVSATSQDDPLTFGGEFIGEPTPDFGLKIVNEHSAGFQFGIIGETDSEDGRGVAGFANRGSGSSIGVLGRNESEDGTGIRAVCDADTGNTKGIFGQVESPDGRGIYATNKASSGPAYGCVAQSNAISGTALLGTAISKNGETRGVHGLADSSDGAGVLAENTGGGLALQADGDANVTGHTDLGGDTDVSGSLSIGKLGIEAYLDEDEEVGASAGSTLVPFDTEVTNDHFTFSSNGAFTVEEDGSYLVTTQVTWDDETISQNETTSLTILVNGTPVAQKRQVISTNSVPYSLSLSKTLRGLEAPENNPDSITVEVQHSDSTTWTIRGEELETWIEITRVG